MNNITILKYKVENKKIVGVLVESLYGDTAYLTIKDYELYLKNTNKKSLIRFANESNYEEVTLDFDKLEIKNEFDNEYFCWYKDQTIALKK